MLKFTFKRLLIAVPQLIGISLMTFILLEKTPGNFFDTLRMNPQISPETISRYEQLYHLDDPFFIKYFYWLKSLLCLDFGHSFFYNVPVEYMIGSRLWNTFVLSLASFLLTWGVAIPLGIWAALRRNEWVDRFIQICSYFSLSSPGFFLAMIFLYGASQWGFLPLGGMHSANYEDLNPLKRFFDLLLHLCIPTLALSLGSIGSLQKIMRGNMLEVLRQQYILAARAKGLPEHRIIYHHALRNAMNPLITLLGYEFSGLLSGAALIEIITSWPGLGSLMLVAVRSKDFYLVMANMMMGGVLFLIGNLLADILLAKSDPRIRYDEK